MEVVDVPVIDRAIVEHLFGLRRRRAIELLHRFGGYQAGRTFLIDRRLLIDELRRLGGGQEFELEIRRKQRLGQAVDELRLNQAATAVRIPVRPEPACRIADLPADVALEPGQLRVDFCGTEDLLSKLYELSQAAAQDFDRFRAAAEPVERRSA